MKRNLYIRNTHTKHIPHGREIPSNKKKRRHLSYNAENIKEIWVQWGWRNRAFLWDLDLVIVPVNAHTCEKRERWLWGNNPSLPHTIGVLCCLLSYAGAPFWGEKKCNEKVACIEACVLNIGGHGLVSAHVLLHMFLFSMRTCCS